MDELPSQKNDRVLKKVSYMTRRQRRDARGDARSVAIGLLSPQFIRPEPPLEEQRPAARVESTPCRTTGRKVFGNPRYDGEAPL